MREMDGTPGQPTPIDAALLMMRFLYAALLGSVAVYLVVVHVIALGDGPPFEASVRLVLAIAAAACGLAAPLMRRVLMPPRAEPRGPAPSHISPGGFARVFVAHIVAWALCESVTVFGLVMVFLTRDRSALYPFAAGAVLMFLVLAPRRGELEAVARAEQGA